MGVLEGELVVYQGGVEVGRERYRDGGERLESEIRLGPQEARVVLEPGRVVVEAGGRRLEQALGAGEIAIENGSFQAFSRLAGRSGAPEELVGVVPSQGARVPLRFRATPDPGGGTRLEIAVGGERGLELFALVGPDGALLGATIPAQRVEVRQASAPAPEIPSRPLPKGVSSQSFELRRGSVRIDGELWRPARILSPRLPVVVVVAGSGPTDRDGNSELGLRTDAYRMLAEALASRGVATLRYDKRGVGRSSRDVDEASLEIGDLAGDLAGLVRALRRNTELSPVTIFGHSEGALLALLASAEARPDALVLACAPGRPLGAVLRDQLAGKLGPHLLADFDRLLDAIRESRPLDHVPPELRPVLRPSVARYLASQIDLDPVALLGALSMPEGSVSAIAGEHDVQVRPADVGLLAAARPRPRFTRVPAMNHVLKEEPNPALPQPSYADPARPLAPGLVDAVLEALAR